MDTTQNNTLDKMPNPSICPLRMIGQQVETDYILINTNQFSCIKEKCAIWDTYYTMCALARHK